MGISDRDSAMRLVATTTVVATAAVFVLPAGDALTRWTSEVGSLAAAFVLLGGLLIAQRRAIGFDRLAWTAMFGSTAALVALYLIDPVRPGTEATEFSAALFVGPFVTIVQIGALGLLARRLTAVVPTIRLLIDSVWLGTAALLLTWGIVGGPVVDHAEIGAFETWALVAQVGAGALLLGFLLGLGMLADRDGRRALVVLAAPAAAIAIMQGVYGRAFVEGRLTLGSLSDFALPLAFATAAVAALESRRSRMLRPKFLRPGHGQMTITFVPLVVWGVTVWLSWLSLMPDQRWLGVGVGATAVVRLMVLVSENVNLARSLHDQTSHDHLTGLSNRVAIERMVECLGDGPAGLLLVDLDRFKAVNDTLGHAAGDDLLILVARRMELAVGPGWTVARLAGDEFVVLTTDYTDSDSVAEVGRRIIDRLSLPFHLDGREAWIGASVGAASTDENLHASELLDVADLAMRSAKDRDHGDVVKADAEVRRRARDRGALEIALRHAVERDEFYCVFQPKVDIFSGAMVGVEALVRWKRPGVGTVPPDEFISIAEASGLIAKIDSWVLSNAVSHLRRWNRMRTSCPRLHLSANMSAWQLARIDLDVEVGRAISWEGGVDPAQLTIELTETLLVEDPEVVARRLRKLRSTGVGVSVDDFGAGFTSVAYLRKFPISEVKIDRDLVWELQGDDTDDKSVVAAVIALARAMDLEVVAEGVETRQQAESLRRLGATVAQGYLFAKPLPAEEIDAIVDDPFPFAHLVGPDDSGVGTPESPVSRSTARP